MEQCSYSSRRARGLVWVCDLENSSKHLNDNATAAEFEEFLQRFHWLSKTIVDASGGVFIKWTGDGFLAWYETPLHRDLAKKANDLFEALWHLSSTVNVTQLGIRDDNKFRVRHGVAYEHDALLTNFSNQSGHEALDIIGRAVVLAFRLAGISNKFPHVTTQAAAVEVAPTTNTGRPRIAFKRWHPSADDKLKYFKGETWGTKHLLVSDEKPPRRTSSKGFLKSSKKVIARVEDPSTKIPSDSFIARYMQSMSNGPIWAQKVLEANTAFNLRMLNVLKEAAEAIAKDLASKK